MSLYSNILRVRQASPQVNFTISNYFPLLGDSVTLNNTSKNVDSFEWTLDDSSSVTNNTIDNTINLTPQDYGDLLQRLTVSNTVGTLQLDKYIYPLPIPDRAYYTFSLDNNVSRVGETFQLTLNNLYNRAGLGTDHTVEIIITDHTDGSEVNRFVTTNLVNTINTPISRGIYDIEVITTTGTLIVQQKQELILTVNPSLQVRGSALEHEFLPTEDNRPIYGVERSIIDGSNYNGMGTTILPGTTIVLQKNPDVDNTRPFRLELINLIGTEANPIVITFDEAIEFDMPFEIWNGVNINNCQHVILDGKGYQNLNKGWKIYAHPNAEFATAGIQGANFSSDIEIHNIDIGELDFAGVFIKTDPDVNNPNTWRPHVDNPTSGHTLYNLRVHNCDIHDMLGEGFYLGYFDAGVLTATDDDSTQRWYRAHQLIDTKLYRNNFNNCGWDSLQLNNAYGETEIAYNILINSGVSGEFGQNAGMSISLEGKVYNNIILGGTGSGIQYMPFGKLDVYNNIIAGLNEGSDCLLLLSASGNAPETRTTPNNLYNNNTNDDGDPISDIEINVFNNLLFTEGNGFVQNAQNVIQWEGYNFYNNITKYNDGFYFGGQALATNTLWETNSHNNINYTTENSRELKIVDIDNLDFRHYLGSNLSKGGVLSGSTYDLRGFKNWDISDTFIGPYSSIIAPLDNLLRLDNLIINDGDVSTENLEVNVTFEFLLDTPLEYRISESDDFTNITWLPWSGNNVTYTIQNNSGGTKTLYAQLKKDSHITSTQSDSIEYIPMPLETTIISLGNTNGFDNSVTEVDSVTGDIINFTSYEYDEGKSNLALLDRIGNPSGTMIVKPSELPIEANTFMRNISAKNSEATGNTGVYADKYFKQLFFTNDSQISTNVSAFSIKDLPEGDYKLRLYRSSNQQINAGWLYDLNIQANNSSNVNPIREELNNVSDFTELRGILVGVDGRLDIIFSTNSDNKFEVPGFNLIEIIPEVLDRSMQTYLIDFSSNVNGRQTVTPYNYLHVSGNTTIPLNTTFDLGTTDNQNEGVSLVITSSNWQIQDNGVQIGTDYLAEASRDSFSVANGDGLGTMELRGLDDSSVYTIKILQSRAFVTSDVNTTIQGVTQSINQYDNVTVLEWVDVIPVNGVITISTESTTVTQMSNFNVMEIDKRFVS
jgi:hypothetical protein